MYYKNKDYASAIKYHQMSLKTAQDVGYIMLARDVSFELYEIYKATGNIKHALEMHELFITTRDSIEIVKQYDFAIGEIKCFLSQLNQVFTNFIDNAR